MILYHVTTCKAVDSILTQGLIAKEISFGKQTKANIWFTDEEGVGVVARYWVRSNACIIKCDIPKSYVKVVGITYYGPSEYAMEYYIRVKFKVKWIVDVQKYKG